MNPRNSRGGDDPPARPGARRRAPAVDVVLRHRRHRGPARSTSHWEALEWLRAHGFRVNGDIVRLDDRGRGRRAVPATGRSAAARSTSRSTASSSRSTTSSCSGGSASSAATRAGRSPGSSRRRPRSRALNEINWNVGKFGDLHPFAELEPVHVGGVTVKRGDAAQRGGPRAQGPARRRRGDRPARRRRDPAGPLARAARGRAPGPRPGAARPERCPFCDTPTVKPRAPSSPAARTATARSAAGSCSRTSPRGDGHRRARREAGRDLPASRARDAPPADFYRLDARAAARARRLRRDLRRPSCSTRIERLARAAVRRACCSRSASRASATSPAATSPQQLPHDRRAARRDAGADRRDARASARSWRELIHDQLADEQMRALIDDLRGVGLRFEEEGPPPGEGPLAGKTFVLTGTLPDLTREQATERILAAGGRVTRRSRRRPTTSSRARRRAPSSRRPSGSASRCSTRPGCWRCWTRPAAAAANAASADRDRRGRNLAAAAMLRTAVTNTATPPRNATDRLCRRSRRPPSARANATSDSQASGTPARQPATNAKSKPPISPHAPTAAMAVAAAASRAAVLRGAGRPTARRGVAGERDQQPRPRAGLGDRLRAVHAAPAGRCERQLGGRRPVASVPQ